jgi:hypothetical protein
MPDSSGVYRCREWALPGADINIRVRKITMKKHLNKIVALVTLTAALVAVSVQAQTGQTDGSQILPSPVGSPVQPFTNYVRQYANPVQPFSNYVRQYTNPVQPFTNYVRQYANPVQPFTNYVRQYANPVQPFTNYVRPYTNPVRPFTNYVRQYANPVQPLTNPLPANWPTDQRPLNYGTRPNDSTRPEDLLPVNPSRPVTPPPATLLPK